MSTKPRYTVYYQCYICDARSPSPAHPEPRCFEMCSDESMVNKKSVEELFSKLTEAVAKGAKIPVRYLDHNHPDHPSKKQ